MRRRVLWYNDIKYLISQDYPEQYQNRVNAASLHNAFNESTAKSSLMIN